MKNLVNKFNKTYFKFLDLDYNMKCGFWWVAKGQQLLGC